jgi:hypothetical protein
MSVSASRDRETWGALLHVRPLPGRDGGLAGAAGAFAWVFALAGSETEYRVMVSAEMANLGLCIAEVDQLDRYDPHPDDSDETRRCFERLSEEWPVQYDSFHSFSKDES